MHAGALRMPNNPGNKRQTSKDMDSGNSGSLQSSSNGEEEYDSQPEQTTPNFSNIQNIHFSSPSNPQLHSFSHLPTNIFHLSSNYSQETSIQNPSTLNLHSHALRSEPRTLAARGSACHGGTSSTSVQPRASRKRTRASRRAPTTVLTTDTSNFRAMVQEFTGIPSSPFSSSSLHSRRFDLFGSSSFYPTRPSAQKVQLPQFIYSSSPSSSPLLNMNMITVDASNNAISNSSNNFNPSSNFYPLPSDNTASMQGPVLSFQPFLHAFKSDGSTFGRIPSLDELGLSHNGISDPPTLTDGQRLRKEATFSGERQHDNARFLETNVGSSSSGLQTIMNNCKLNFPGFSSEFNHEKGLESIVVSSRGEATVDSWICPSG